MSEEKFTEIKYHLSLGHIDRVLSDEEKERKE